MFASQLSAAQAVVRLGHRLGDLLPRRRRNGNRRRPERDLFDLGIGRATTFDPARPDAVTSVNQVDPDSSRRARTS